MIKFKCLISSSFLYFLISIYETDLTMLTNRCHMSFAFLLKFSTLFINPLVNSKRMTTNIFLQRCAISRYFIQSTVHFSFNFWWNNDGGILRRCLFFYRDRVVLRDTDMKFYKYTLFSYIALMDNRSISKSQWRCT